MRTARESGESAEAWLTRLIGEHQESLIRMCFMYLHDRAMAEDAVQETFLKAYRTMDSFRGACSEKTWLARLAINTCRDMQRAAWFRHTDRRVTPEDMAAVQAAPPEEDDAEALAMAIVRLPARYREVILLYYYQDMTMKEVASALGIAVSSVSGRIKRACARLHQALEKGDAHG